MKVALIVGHKEFSPGAKNTFTDEFKVNTKLVDDIIDKNDGYMSMIKVVRSSYERLPSEVDELKADMAIEFHCNSSISRLATGTEVLFPVKCNTSKEFAGIMQNAIVSALGLRDRGVLAVSIADRGGYLLNNLKTRPCVILEPFFLSNPSDFRAYSDNRDKYVDMLLIAIYQMADVLRSS